ncbi:MAG: glycosyltransferase [Acidobacteria bacterium]|nr:glycosyltransferase [Acidobacteriota bacterium]
MLHVTESLRVQYGGLAVTCARLASHLAQRGVEVSVATIDNRAAGPTVPLDPGVATVRCTPTGPRRLGFSRELDRALAVADPGLLHVHGLWRGYLAQAARYSRSRGRPLIVSAHGMLHRSARRQRSLIKAAVRRLGQDALLGRAACLHATAEEEAEEIRSLRLDLPVAVIPWGVDPPAPAQRRAPAGRVVLFLGRFHATKGVFTLLRAWARAARGAGQARLVLAGYDGDGYRARCEALAASLGVAPSVSFRDAVAGTEREQLFADADVLVLPSPSENFGLVVPEALVRGIPVIATHGSPWRSLTEQRCGWWVAAGDGPLAAALDEALAAAGSDLRAMGERGRRFAGTRFTWPQAAASMCDLYAWALGLAPIPGCLRPT